jgi:AcrR family transcriptional regulator
MNRVVMMETNDDGEGPAAGCPRRPLRRDAERNRQRILTAAAEVFTERGLDVSLDEIAKHAGVGVGTVYRRFADKEELVETLFTDYVNNLASIAERALEMPDPEEALLWFLDQWIGVMAGNMGLRQLLMFATYSGDRVSYARNRFAPLVDALVTRAQASGQVRADLAGTDIPFIGLMLSSAAEYAQHMRPEIWRRYLTLFIDGMYASRDLTTPLPVTALTAAEMEAVMRRQAPRR